MSKEKKLYLDHAATTLIREEVLEEMEFYLKEGYGNASSLYSLGIKTKNAINKSRKKIAQLLGCKPEELYFTSGGCESNNWAIKSVAFMCQKGHIIISSIEHESIMQTASFLEEMGFAITMLEVDGSGLVDLQKLNEAIRDNTILVSIMYANNEIGTIQPIEEIIQICHAHNILFHTDFVQAMPHIKIDLSKLNVNMLSISGHKINAPKGIGLLYVRSGFSLLPLIHGGRQENGMRAGTENTAFIVGLAKAVELIEEEKIKNEETMEQLRAYLLKELELRNYDFIVNGNEEHRLASIINICFKNLNGRILATHLDNYGIYLSTGSACNSDSILPSHVLTAINMRPEYILGAIRISLGYETQKEDINFFLDSLDKIFMEYQDTLLL